MELTQRTKVTRLTLQMLLVISAFMAGVLMVYAAFGMPSIYTGDGAPRSYSNDWSIQNGVSSKKISLPNSGALTSQGTLVLTNVIPSEVGDADVLCLLTNHQNLSVELDGTLIFSYESAGGIGEFFGKSYHFIPLSADMAGQQITLTFTTFDNVSSTYVEVPRIGTSGAIYRWIMAENALPLISGVFFLLFGLVLIGGAVVMYAKKMRQKCAAVLMLGLFFVLSALSELYQTGLLSFIISNEGFLYLLGYTAQMMFMVPLLLYFMEVLNFRHRFSSLLCNLLMMNFIIQLIIYVYQASDFANMEAVTLLLWLISAVYFVVILCVECVKYHRRETCLALVAMSVFLLMTAVDTAFHFLFPNISVRGFDSVCLLVCRVILVADVIRLFVGELQERMGEKLGNQMAFIDGLTHMANRSSYNRHVESLCNHLDMNLKVTIVDVRLSLPYLLRINELEGYNAGDEVVNEAAKCVSRSFKNTGKCYRISGNEFVVIFEQRTPEEINAAIDTFRRTVSEFNESHIRSLHLHIGRADNTGVVTRERVTEMVKEAIHNSERMYELVYPAFWKEK